MASTAPIGSFRDAIPNRSILSGGLISQSTSVVTEPDAAKTFFNPVQGALHTVASTAAVTWTITDASAPLPYDLKIGEGFLFFIQNNDGADAITVAVAGNVTAGAGTFTVPSARTRIFSLTRISNLVHQLNTLGVLTHG